MFGKKVRGASGKVLAVCDIGSGSAAVGIFTVRKGKPALVLAAERALLPIEERTKETTITALGEHLVQAGTDVLKLYTDKKQKEFGAVQEVYCVIRAPWSRSKTTSATSKSEKDTVVAESAIAALSKQALAAETELDKTNLLDATVMRVELNGYPTGEPVGKRSREITVHALVSDCDSTALTTVKQAIEKLFPHMPITFRASTRALLAVLRKEDKRGDDYFVVDLVSEGTVLTVMREGIVERQQFVTEGVRSIIKRVAPSGLPEETLGIIRMLERDQCTTAACEAVRAKMAEIEPELVRAFGEGMGALAALRRLPNNLVLLVQPDMMPWFTTFFSRIDFSQFTITMQPFSVMPILSKDLTSLIVPDVGVAPDTGLVISTALVNREKNEQ